LGWWVICGSKKLAAVEIGSSIVGEYRGPKWLKWVTNGPLRMGGQSAIKIVRQPTKNSCSAPGDHARSNSSDKISATRNVEGGGGAAVAKRAGLQASRAWSVLSVDGCYLGWSPKMIGDWHHGTPVFERG
jgi:hypothetical protein